MHGECRWTCFRSAPGRIDLDGHDLKRDVGARARGRLAWRFGRYLYLRVRGARHQDRRGKNAEYGSHDRRLWLSVDRVVGDGLRLHLFPPVRRLCRNGDDVALAQLMRLATLHVGGADLPRGGVFGADKRPTRDERGLALDDDEDVIGLVVDFDLA